MYFVYAIHFFSKHLNAQNLNSNSLLSKILHKMNKFFSVLVFLSLGILALSCNQNTTPAASETEKPTTLTNVEDADFDLASIPMDPKALDNESGLEITLETNGFAADEIYIAHYYGSKQYINDTVQVRGNKAVFKKDKKLPRGIYMFVFPPRNTYLEFIMGYDQHFKSEN